VLKLRCLDCGVAITNVYTARSAELEWDGEKWIEKHVFSETISCKHCYRHLSDGEISELGIPV